MRFKPELWFLTGLLLIQTALADNPANGTFIKNGDVTAGLEILPVARVWAGHPGGFALLTHGELQFVGYYDSNRQLCVAQRKLGETQWTTVSLDTFVDWDSHNYITMVIDRDGYLHVSGNMHVSPLVYFRSKIPLDARALERIPAMTGQRETRCTYPRFFFGPDGALVFAYRDGMSGQGDTLYNIYNEATKTWRRLLEQPIFSGDNKMSCYPIGPDLGPDGYYHLTWVWRDTINAETNHDLSYARSRDLVHWETMQGNPIALPITLATPGVIVDPIPVKGGIINGSGIAGFDREKRVVIAYHKFDAQGFTQLYFARDEGGAWKIHQATDWTYRWYFQGGGSLNSEIKHGALVTSGNVLSINIKHPLYGSANWTVDAETLHLGRKIAPTIVPLLARLAHVESSFPGMGVRWAKDSTMQEPRNVSYRLRWESLDNNRDQPRLKPWPEPSLLEVVAVPLSATELARP